MDTATITATALETLDDTGLDGLSMRRIATRLGVHVGGLYYYLPDKAALVRSMADEVCREALAALPAETSDWALDATAFCRTLRTTLRARRDAARILCAGPLNASAGALALMDRLIGILERGLRPDEAAGAADTLMSYLTGFVLQEQSDGDSAAYVGTLEELRERYPRVFRAAGTDDDTLFERSITAILRGWAG